jgi:type IV pilus assembly protein PilO
VAVQDLVDQLSDFDINDVDWTRMGVWPIAGKVVLCIIIVAAMIGGCYFFVVKDLSSRLQSVEAQEQTLRQTFTNKAFQAANLDAYREQMKEMEKSFGALVAQLPSDTEVPGLLEDIDEKGAESGLVISSIELQPERSAEFYVELPISVKVSGSYHDLGNFVSGIAGMPRIVTLHDYNIDKSDSGGLLDMTIIAKTYRYRSQEQ